MNPRCPSRDLDRCHASHEPCRVRAVHVAPLVPYYYTPVVSFTLNQYTRWSSQIARLGQDRRRAEAGDDRRMAATAAPLRGREQHPAPDPATRTS